MQRREDDEGNRCGEEEDADDERMVLARRTRTRGAAPVKIKTRGTAPARRRMTRSVVLVI